MIDINLIELIYPKTCGMCGEICKSYVCNKCKIRVNKLLYLTTTNYMDKYFNSHTYLFKYEGIIREILLQYKFREQSYLYKFFSEIIVNNCFFLSNYDIILPVPIHKKRKNTRGYNQTELIAKDVSKSINLQYDNKVLIKTVNSIQQSTLTKTQRERNVLGVYRIENSQRIVSKNILLFDDIYTTGSTVNECSKVLKHEGAKVVDVLTIAKD